mgnify:CR=1 FL=1|jgi:hypothetical protein
MQGDNRHIDSPDNFSRKVGEKARNHIQPVDASVWEGIEKRLSVKKRPLVPWKWIAASVAAVAIGLIFLLTLPEKEPAEQMIVESTRGVKNAQSEQSVQDEQTATPKPQKDKKGEAETFVPEKSHQPLLASTKRSTEELLAMYHREEEQAEVDKTVEQQGLETAETFVEKPMDMEASTDSTISKESHEDVLLAEVSETAAVHPQLQKHSKPSLLLAISGASVDANLDFADREAMYADAYIGSNESAKDLTNSENQYATLTPSDYSEVRHLPPISFSIMGSFPLDKTWSIETGLMYTYMTSLFSRPGNVEYSGKLMLHYLGVPVSLKATIYQSNRWNIYLLGGGSVEKGLLSHYRQQIRYADGAIKHTYVRSKINGLQFSVHVATGFGYKINNSIQLFGEPRIVYYFNNNQPMSARTESPFTVGLNGGVRINF